MTRRRCACIILRYLFRRTRIQVYEPHKTTKLLTILFLCSHSHGAAITIYHHGRRRRRKQRRHRTGSNLIRLCGCFWNQQRLNVFSHCSNFFPETGAINILELQKNQSCSQKSCWVSVTDRSINVYIPKRMLYIYI